MGSCTHLGAVSDNRVCGSQHQEQDWMLDPHCGVCDSVSNDKDAGIDRHRCDEPDDDGA